MDDFEQRVGEFNRFFDKSPLYLEFLNLSDPADCIRMIHEVIEASDDLENELRSLLDAELNWRPHLVGGMAMLLNDDIDLNAEAWRAIDTGSWVAPQLAAILYFRDPGFSRNARLRLQLRCPMLETRFLRTAEEVFPQQGWKEQHAAKCVSTLLALGALTPSLSGWVKELADQEDVRSMLQNDYDGGGELATTWMTRLVEQFAAMDKPLVRSES